MYYNYKRERFFGRVDAVGVEPTGAVEKTRRQAKIR